MKMNNNTMQKVQNLHNMFSDKVTFNHYSYAVWYKKFAGMLPSWQTLKNHGLIIFDHVDILTEAGYDDEFIAVNVYRVNF